MMKVEGRLVGRTCTIGNTVMPPWTSPAYVLVTNESHAVSQLSGLDANQQLFPRNTYMAECLLVIPQRTHAKQCWSGSQQQYALMRNTKNSALVLSACMQLAQMHTYIGCFQARFRLSGLRVPVIKGMKVGIRKNYRVPRLVISETV